MKIFRLVALFPVYLVFLGACDSAGDKSTAELLLAAEAAIDGRDVATGRVNALNAAAREPQNPSVRAVLGEVLLRANDAAVAEIEFEKAIELGLTSDHVYPLLAEALLAQGKVQDLENLALPKNISVRSHVPVLSFQAEAMIMGGRLPDAARLLKQIETLDPALPEAVLAKARFLMALSRLAEAEDLIDGLVSGRPDDYKAWLRLGQIRDERGDTAGAITAFDKAVELAYVPGIERQYRALALLSAGDIERARADYQELVKRYPDAPIVAFLAGYFEYEVGNYDDAQSLLDGVLAEDAAHSASLLLAAAAYGQTGSLQIARHYLDRLRRLQSAGSSDRVAILAAFLNLLAGDAKTADTLLDSVGQIPALDDYVAQLRVRTAVVMEGDSVASAGDSGSIAAITLKPPPAEFALLRREKLAAEPADEPLQQSTGTETARNYQDIRTAVDRGDFEAARMIADANLERNPEDPNAHLLVGIAALARQDVATAHESYSRAVGLAPDFLPALRSLATIEMLQGNFAEAARLHTKIVELSPQDYQALLAAAAAEVARNDLASAQRWLEQAVELRPGAYEPVELLARLMGRRGDPGGALAFLNSQQLHYEDNTKFLALHARMAQEAGDQAATLADFERLAALLPDDALIAVRHGELLRDAGDVDGYEAELARALAIEPRLDEVRRTLVVNALRRDDLAGAKKRLGSPEDRADSPRLLTLSAAIASRENRPDDAVRLAERAFDLAPNNLNLIALAKVQRAAGREKEALAGLSAWAKENPEDLLTLNYLGDTLLEMGQPDAAVALYETSLERNPQQPAVMNNLAWVLRETDLDRAHELAQGAVALAPDNKDLQDTLAVVEQLMANRN